MYKQKKKVTTKKKVTNLLMCAHRVLYDVLKEADLLFFLGVKTTIAKLFFITICNKHQH